METLITKEERIQMIKNGKQTKIDHIGNHWPVVCLFTPSADYCWLLSELNPEEPDIAFGLCDLGMGFPEIGFVRLSDIMSWRITMGIPVMRYDAFKATKSLLDYSSDAHKAGRIVGWRDSNANDENRTWISEEETRNLAGDLVNASSDLVARLEKYGWLIDGLTFEEFRDYMKNMQDRAQLVAGQFPMPALIVYLAALAERLYKRLD